MDGKHPPLTPEQHAKVQKIFEAFDADKDGRLCKTELEAFVQAVNPKTEFTPDQLSAVVDGVDKSNKDFHGGKGLTLDGLAQTYEQGYGKIDDDFSTLQLELVPPTKQLTEEQCRKVRKIFDAFDADKDDRITKQELSNLVQAVNPSVTFDAFQIDAILKEVYKQYESFIDDKGLSFEGLKQTYADEAGDVDRDYHILGLDKVEEDADLGNMMSFPKEAMVDGGMSPEARAILARLNELLKDENVSPKQLTEGLVGLRTETAALATPNAGAEALEIYMAMATGISRKGPVAYPDCFAQSIETCSAALVLRPDCARAAFLMGNSKFGAAQTCGGGMADVIALFDEARRYFSQAIANATGPEDARIKPKMYVNLGITFESMGLLLNACENYRAACHYEPNANFRARKLFGSAMYALGEYAEAEDALQHALAISKAQGKEFEDAHCDLGCVQCARGKYAEAKTQFNIATGLKPDHLEALFNLGNLHRQLDEFTEAKWCYTKVLQHSPHHWKAHLNLGIVLLATGDLKEAESHIDKALVGTGNRIEIYDELKAVKRLNKGGSATLSKVLKSAPPEVKPSMSPINKDYGSNRGYLAARRRGAMGKADMKKVKATGRTLEEYQVRLDQGLLQQLTPFMRLLTIDALKSLARNDNIEPQTGGCLVKKPSAELMLRRYVVGSMSPLIFAHTMKDINKHFFHTLDKDNQGVLDWGFLLCALIFMVDAPEEVVLEAVWSVLNWRNQTSDAITLASLKTFLNALKSIFSSSHPPMAVVTQEGTCTYEEFKAVLASESEGFPWVMALPLLGSRHGWVV